MSEERVRVVSFLGLGDWKLRPDDRYVSCRHCFVEGSETFTTEVSTPLHDLGTWEWLRSHRKLQPENISIVLLGTDKVQAHWEAAGHVMRLERVSGLFEAGFEPRIGFARLDDGDDKALWSVFETVRAALVATPLDALTLGERVVTETGRPTEIIVDITHGFRSQPFLAAAVLVYVSSQLKRAARDAGPDAPPPPRLRILYAAFEKNDRGEPPITPVWELTRFLDVLDWDGALDDLMRHGRGDALQGLLEGVRKQRLEDSADPSARAAIGKALAPLSKLASATRNFADALTTVRAASLVQVRAGELLGAMTSARAVIDKELPVLHDTFEALARWCQPLQAARLVSPEGLAASLALAQRYARLERYSELSALLRETLISAYTVATRADSQWLQPGGGKDFRLQRAEDEYRLNVLAKGAEARHLRPLLPPHIEALAAALDPLVDVRNDVQHAGFNPQPAPAAHLRTKLKELRARVTQAVEPLLVAPAHPIDLSPIWVALAPPAPPMNPVFFNCSNHPSALWSAVQRDAALALGAGNIVDVPFPAVPAFAGDVEVAALAQGVLATLLADGTPAAVHVAGEFTLSFTLVDRLLSLGVPTVAAAAERRVMERQDADGHTAKESLFVFSGWRTYARLRT